MRGNYFLGIIAFFIIQFPVNHPDFVFLNSHPSHDFHTSIAEMDYNEESKSFEISLRVFTDDFEKGLSTALNHEKYGSLAMAIFGGKNSTYTKDKNLIQVSLDNKNTVYDKLIEQYVQYNFRLIVKDEPRIIKFIGKELEADVTWIYFEIPLKENPKDIKFQNAILSDIFEDQSNVVNVAYKGEKKTFLFNTGNTIQEFGFWD